MLIKVIGIIFLILFILMTAIMIYITIDDLRSPLIRYFKMMYLARNLFLLAVLVVIDIIVILVIHNM